MKKLLFGAALLLLLGSCSGNGNGSTQNDQNSADSTIELSNREASAPTTNNATDNQVEAAATSQQNQAELEQSARDFVNNMYAVVFKRSHYPVDKTYFTPEFVKLYKQTIKKEEKEMSESDSDGGMDAQFFDTEFWSSYNDDPKSAGAKAKITKVTIDENKNGVATANVVVKISPPGNDNSIKINLLMTDDGWKIDDYRNYKKPMQRYVKS